MLLGYFTVDAKSLARVSSMGASLSRKLVNQSSLPQLQTALVSRNCL
jgi:hypothetical protein